MKHGQKNFFKALCCALSLAWRKLINPYEEGCVYTRIILLIHLTTLACAVSLCVLQKDTEIIASLERESIGREKSRGTSMDGEAGNNATVPEPNITNLKS